MIQVYKSPFRYFTILFLLLCLTIGCKPVVKEDSSPVEPKIKFLGTMAKVISKSGDVFEDSQYLPLPLNHCIITNMMRDTLDILVMGRPVNKDSVSFFPYGYFEVRSGKINRPFVLAMPEEDKLLAFERMDFQDMMLSKYSIKVIIDIWFANYKGLSKTQVTKWNETVYAENIVKDFLNKRPKPASQKKE